MDHFEQQLGTGLRQRHIAEFVDDEQLVPRGLSERAGCMLAMIVYNPKIQRNQMLGRKPADEQLRISTAPRTGKRSREQRDVRQSIRNTQILLKRGPSRVAIPAPLPALYPAVLGTPTKRADFSRHGYRAVQFDDAFARFLPDEPNTQARGDVMFGCSDVYHCMGRTAKAGLLAGLRRRTCP
jgi:hypothetical protein